MKNILEGFARKGRELFVRPTGPLTRELLQKPGNFGLGLVPNRLAADTTTSMTCGFCSTGCSLNVLLKNGEAIGLVPDPEYPVNQGMACPKGWEALTPLAGPGRATTPLIRRDGQLVPTDWETAVFELVDK